MRARKTKPQYDERRAQALRRKELLSLEGSLSAKDAKTLRAAVKILRKSWR